MKIQLSEHFTYPKLLRFVFPSVVMMVFISIYGVVDGLFVSNIVGKTAFAAVNLIYPVFMLLGTVGFVFGTGGSALVAKTMGEGDYERANSYFSMLIKVTVICGVVLTVLGVIFIRPISVMLGAEGQLLEDCTVYGITIFLGLTAFMLQNVFQSFFVTAEKPQMGLYVTVGAGITNIVFDYLFIAVFDFGIIGAGAATALSQVVGGVIPLIYFLRENSSTLRLKKASIDTSALIKVCINGSSEFMTQISLSLVNILYNFQFMRIAGENGIAAYGVIMYVNFVFISIFIGYSIGSSPIVGYHYGAENHSELRNMLQKSVVLIGVTSIAMTVAGILLASPFSKIFVGYDPELFEMTAHGFKIYAFSFLICGFNIFASGFFTALNDGVVSAIISFLRTLLFQVICVLALPVIFGIDGIWSAVIVAELLALVVSAGFIVVMRRRYHY